MLLLLPPSETKRDGGVDDTTLDLSALSYQSLRRQRRAALAGLASVSRGVAASMTALGLGATQRIEIERNRAVRSSPVLPALDRYTGVLYDAMSAATLDATAREFAAHHVVIHSALFGLVGAGDKIPAYRLSHDSRLPGISLRTLWRGPVSDALAEHPGLLLDLRSASYAALGPAPAGSWRIRVVSEDAAGRRIALSHFNKAGKGQFARAVVDAGVQHESVESLLSWATTAGIQLDRGAAGELDLAV